jgi:hypothetical protein
VSRSPFDDHRAVPVERFERPELGAVVEIECSTMARGRAPASGRRGRVSLGAIEGMERSRSPRPCPGLAQGLDDHRGARPVGARVGELSLWLTSNPNH